MKVFLLNLFIVAQAQTVPGQSSASKVFSTDKIKVEMKKLRSLKAEDFIRQVDDYRNTVDKFIEHKKRVCNGEFSKIVIGEGVVGSKEKTLTKQEKDECFKELLNLQVTYIDNLFAARSRFLTYQHDLRIKNLNQARKKSIEDIKGKFTKKRRRKKSRR